MEKILVVNHELSHLCEYNTLLSSAGYGVITAVDVEKGLEEYNREKPDLVLMDIMVPGINYYETARRIRQENSTFHAPIIFISDAVGDIEQKIDTAEPGDIDFLIKPVEDRALLLKIRASLRMKHLYDELHATRSMLQRSEAKYRMVLETMQDGFFEVDLEGRVTFFNDAALRIIGYPREKLTGMSFRGFMTPASGARAGKAMVELLNGGTMRPSEYEIIRSDGSVRLLEVAANLIKGKDLKPVGYRGIIKDITELRDASRELLVKSFAVEKSINAIAIMDTSGRCTFANNSFLMMWGCAGRNEVLGKSITDFCHPDNRDDFMNIMEVLEEIGSWVGELSLKKKDDLPFFVILSAALIKNETDETIGIIMSFVDITLRRKADHSLRESKDVLAKRTRMMEKDLKIAKTALDGIIMQKVPDVGSVLADYRYFPMETLGGDFFSFYPYDHGGLGVFICDISGHGVASSLFLTLLKSITDRLSMRFGDSPADFITQLNMELVGHMSSFFITGIYGIFTRRQASGDVLFSYANGGHPGPILVKKSGQIMLHSAKSTLIGISNDIIFKTSTIRMDRGERLFLYTDGIPETSNMRREMIGFENELLELFRKSHQFNLSENLDNIVNQVNHFRDGAMLTDDMLIMGFEAAG